MFPRGVIQDDDDGSADKLDISDHFVSISLTLVQMKVLNIFVRIRTFCEQPI